ILHIILHSEPLSTSIICSIYHLFFYYINEIILFFIFFFFFSSRRRHTRSTRDWSSDVCSSDLFYMTGKREWVNNGVNNVNGPFIDRKSTRLNSSHEWISYAVFCLKKKTKNTKNVC